MVWYLKINEGSSCILWKWCTMRQKVLWDILMKLFMSLNKSSIHPSLNYLSKMNAGLHFHRSAFRTASQEGLLEKPNIRRNTNMSIKQNATFIHFIHLYFTRISISFNLNALYLNMSLQFFSLRLYLIIALNESARRWFLISLNDVIGDGNAELLYLCWH